MKKPPWSLISAAVFSLILLLPYFNQHWHLADDAAYGILNTLLLQARTISEGMWPLWNPNVGLGTPWALVPGTGLYYPPQTLCGLLFGWSEVKYIAYLYCHLVFGGWLAAAFARRSGLTEAASIFFALAFLGNGLFIGFFSNPSLWVLHLYWPLLGLGLIELLEQGPARRFRAIAQIAIALFVIQVIGYPLTKFLMFLCSFLLYFVVVRRPGTWLRGPAWKPVFLATAVAMLASLPEWATTFQALPLSERLNSDFYDQALFHNVANFLQLGTALFPSQFVARNQSQLGIMHLERSWWVGTLTLAVLFYAWKAQLLRFRGIGTALVICLFCFLFSLGGHSFFRELFGTTLPIFMYLRQSHLARQMLVVLLIYLGAAGFSALESRKTPKGGGRKGDLVPGLWLGFLVLSAVLALSEKDHAIDPRLLYQDLDAGWKVDLLHELFYLLLAYTAYSRGFLFLRSLRWPAAVVAIQLLCLADAGYALRRMIAEPGDKPIKSVETAFRVASPQPNSRSTKGMFDGTDWYGWDGNLKSLNAYFAPRHKLLQAAINDPGIAPALGTLVSCFPLEGVPASCQGVQLTIDYYFGNRILLTGVSPQPTRILVHDLVDPYWQASVNRQNVPIQNGLGYFKAIPVPQGEFKIDLEYVHPWFPWLWLGPLLGGILLCWAFFNCHRISAGGKSRDGQSGSENPRRFGALPAGKRAR